MDEEVLTCVNDWWGNLNGWEGSDMCQWLF